MLNVAKRGIGGVGNVITTIKTAAVDMVSGSPLPPIIYTVS